MFPTDEQVFHDLAMACVNGLIQDKVLKENRDSEFGIIDASDFVSDVVDAYIQTLKMIPDEFKRRHR